MHYVQVRVVASGRAGLDASTSVSPRIIVGSERGKDPKASEGASGGGSIGLELLVVQLSYTTSRPRYKVFQRFIMT